MPDNKDDKVDFNSDEFHTKLEEQIEPGLREKKPDKKEDKKPAENKADEKITVEDLQKKYDDLVKEKENTEIRYEASNKEGKRLGLVEEEYNKLKPYEELLSRIGSDDPLQKIIENHIKGVSNEEKPGFEDILTDEKAFTSAIAATVGQEMDKRLGIERDRTDKERREVERQAKDKDFQSKYNFSDEKMGEFRDKMKEHKMLTHEDMYKIVYDEELEQKKEQAGLQDTLAQLLKSSDLPKTLASIQSINADDEKSETDRVFDSLKGQVSSVDDMLK